MNLGILDKYLRCTIIIVTDLKIKDHITQFWEYSSSYLTEVCPAWDSVAFFVFTIIVFGFKDDASDVSVNMSSGT